MTQKRLTEKLDWIYSIAHWEMRHRWKVSKGGKRVKNKSSTRYMKKISLKSCKHEDRDSEN